jgi:hypothetical protein
MSDDLDELVDRGLKYCDDYFQACRLTNKAARGKTRREYIMTSDERDLLLAVATIVLANHNSMGKEANKQREALRKALAPFKAEIGAKVAETTP